MMHCPDVCELSTLAVMLPVIGSLVSTVSVQPCGGRAIATGKPAVAAVTKLSTFVILGKTSLSQKSNVHVLVAVVGTLMLVHDGGEPNVGDLWTLGAALASAFRRGAAARRFFYK